MNHPKVNQNMNNCIQNIKNKVKIKQKLINFYFKTKK